MPSRAGAAAVTDPMRQIAAPMSREIAREPNDLNTVSWRLAPAERFRLRDSWVRRSRSLMRGRNQHRPHPEEAAP